MLCVGAIQTKMVNIHCYCTHISGYQVAICPSGSTIFLGGTTFLKRCTFFAFLNLYIGLSIYGMYGMCLDKKLCEASSSQRKAQGLVLAKSKPALPLASCKLNRYHGLPEIWLHQAQQATKDQPL